MNPVDLQAFDLGWDYATFGLNVPPDARKLFCDGYRAFTSQDNKTTHRPNKYVRKWLQIRYGALSRGKEFSPAISSAYLKEIMPVSEMCPVTNERFTYASLAPTDWSVDRANNDRGYVPGNILVMSQKANAAKGDKSLEEIQSLAASGNKVDGLTPNEWKKLALLVEPAFGDDESEVSPIPVLAGQPVALGMPISPLASLQVAISRAIIIGWDPKERELISRYLSEVQGFICKTAPQRKAFTKLLDEVLRRSKHIQSYWRIWETVRVQRRFKRFIQTLDAVGLKRLAKLQQMTIGMENKRLV